MEKKYNVLAIILDINGKLQVFTVEEAFGAYEAAQRIGRLPSVKNYGAYVESLDGTRCDFSWSTMTFQWVAAEQVDRVVFFAIGANGYGQRVYNPSVKIND
jgi:hypothetical protein